MAIPVSEQIAVKVKERLSLIDELDGYEVTASDVVRPTRIAQHSPQDYLLVVTVDKLAPNRESSYPGNPPAQGWDMEIGIVAECRPSEEDAAAIDALRHVFSADVIKAITDADQWHTWDGLAVNSNYGEVSTIDTETGSALRIPLVVQFRTDENNPYNARA